MMILNGTWYVESDTARKAVNPRRMKNLLKFSCGLQDAIQTSELQSSEQLLTVGNFTSALNFSHSLLTQMEDTAANLTWLARKLEEQLLGKQQTITSITKKEK